MLYAAPRLAWLLFTSQAGCTGKVRGLSIGPRGEGALNVGSTIGYACTPGTALYVSGSHAVYTAIATRITSRVRCTTRSHTLNSLRFTTDDA